MIRPLNALTETFLNHNHAAISLAVAVLLGSLIGLERGWEAREKKAGERIAGIRTHALVGLLGGLGALLSQTVTPWVLPALLLGVVAVNIVAYRARVSEVHDYSITSLVGVLLAFCLGAVAVAVDRTLAVAGAVVTALILDNKQAIHGLVNRLQAHELDAALKLLLISVVMLPLLPNQPMGPGGVLNPYAIWWMVVLIAAISFVGYFAVRVGGTEKGLLFTSLFAGLSSSTALTLHFSRQSRRVPDIDRLLAAGILIACGTMFPRILIYCAAINVDLFDRLFIPVALMALTLYLPALVIWRRYRTHPTVRQPVLNQNPLDLGSAVFFGGLLTVILLLGEWLQEWLGNAGVYVLAAASGIADVDAITLSLTRLARDAIDPGTAVIGIILAASVNNLVKAGLALGMGTRGLGLRVLGPMLVSLAVGLAAGWLV